MRRGTKRIRAASAAAACALFAALGTSAASAAPQLLPIPVIPCGDSAALVHQIAVFNQVPAPTHIYLSRNCTYTVSAVDNNDNTGADAFPNITGNIGIVGQGSTIVRSSNQRFRLFHVPAGGKLSLNNLTLANGVSTGFPGGTVTDFGTLNLTDVTLTESVAALGGGLFVAPGATATVVRGAITVNHSTGPGGGVTNDGTLHMTGTLVSGNASFREGGGIDNDGGTLTLDDVAITHNMAINGGGLANDGTASVTVTSSSITGNSASEGAGGVISSSSVVNSSSSIADNSPTNCIGGTVNIPNCSN